MHDPAHALSPVLHAAAHWPALQSGADVPQAAPQAPQLAGSLVTSTQADPHRRLPAAHLHAPALHVSPALQRLPHAPQSSRLLERSTHACPQAVSPSLHAAAH
jgi:hypothetical protein